MCHKPKISPNSAFKPGVGDTIGIGPESAIPGCLESVSESNHAHPWNRYRSRNRSSVGQGISIGIGTENPSIADSWIPPPLFSPKPRALMHKPYLCLYRTPIGWLISCQVLVWAWKNLQCSFQAKYENRTWIIWLPTFSTTNMVHYMGGAGSYSINVLPVFMQKLDS